MTPLARAAARLVGFTRARVRLMKAAAVGAVAFAGLLALSDGRMVTKALVAWDMFSVAYLSWTGRMMLRATPSDMRRHASANDDKWPVILAVLIACVIASFVAIVVELATAPSPAGGVPWWSYTVAGATVLLSWAFTHTLFAVHYAHLYYAPEGEGARGGLDIPGCDEPGYGEFLYFSFVIGCATATADIDITSRQMRNLALVHGILAFAYNTAIVALTINIAASRVGG
jgi:uncharacterized membrane protein